MYKAIRSYQQNKHPAQTDAIYDCDSPLNYLAALFEEGLK